ncbi:MAG: molybdenum cofactor biosynthesis protein MoaE [Alphaproteobacteria bacterium]|nr:molybdenum cofactor biosynthesis protein MoaE [Alphaproteobacteria bacterium]
MLAVVDGAIDVAAVRAAVDAAGHGAILVFEGVARDTFEGRRVLRLEYEAWAEVAEPVLQAIAAESGERWPDARVAVVHRTGVVAIGEPSLVIAVGAPHRPEAFDACRFVLEAVKDRLPVWKKEIYEDGSAWKANAPAGQGG